eukprot:gene15479-17326_t
MDGTAEETVHQWTSNQTENTSQYFLECLIPKFKELIQAYEDRIELKAEQKTEPSTELNAELKAELSKRLEELESQVRQKSFKVSVVAPVKCGKSTFLNCILRASILPEDPLPETAVLVSIIHRANLAVPQLFSVNEDGSVKDCLVEGVQAIYSYLKGFNQYVRERKKSPSLPNPRGFPDCSQLLLKAQIPELNTFNSDFVTFSVVDTPGYNEWGNNTVARDVDAILYLLDMNKPGEESEYKYLSEIVQSTFDFWISTRALLSILTDSSRSSFFFVRGFIRFDKSLEISPAIRFKEDTIVVAKSRGACTVSAMNKSRTTSSTFELLFMFSKY